MGIQFANGGFLTTVQDMGRTGYQEAGMSVSGVMDQRSAALANILAGNDENEDGSSGRLLYGQGDPDLFKRILCLYKRIGPHGLPPGGRGD